MMCTSRFSRAPTLRSMTARWPGPPACPARIMRPFDGDYVLSVISGLCSFGKLRNRPLSPSIANVRFCRMGRAPGQARSCRYGRAVGLRYRSHLAHHDL
jgi:hypothetical protein